MLIPYKIDGKTFNCPTTWENINFNQYLQLKDWNKKDVIKLISIMLKADYQFIANCKTLDIDLNILPRLKFIDMPLHDKNLPPVNSIKFDNIEYKIPTNIKLCSFGQKCDAVNSVADAQEKYKDADYALANVVAIYLQPVIDKAAYDEKRIAELTEHIANECNMVQVFETGRFFLHSLQILQSRNKLRWPLSLIRNKWLLGYLNWVYSRKLTRLMRLQAVTS